MTPTAQHLAASQPTEEERNWGLAAHVLAMVSLFFGPLLVLLIKGNESKWVKSQAIEALNFSITLTIGYVISVPLTFLVVGFCMMIALGLMGVVLHVVAGVKAFQGEVYRYPFALRLIKE